MESRLTLSESEKLMVSTAVSSYYGGRYARMHVELVRSGGQIAMMVSMYIRARYMANVPHGVKDRVTELDMNKYLTVGGQLPLSVGISFADQMEIQRLCEAVDERNDLQRVVSDSVLKCHLVGIL